MKSSYPFGSCPIKFGVMTIHHRILKTLIRHDVTLIYAAYAKCKIQMAYAAYAKIQSTNDFFKEKVGKYK